MKAGFNMETNEKLPFGMNLTEDDKTVVFTTTNGEMRAFDRYMVFEMFLSSPYVFGLGERNNPNFTL